MNLSPYNPYESALQDIMSGPAQSTEFDDPYGGTIKEEDKPFLGDLGILAGTFIEGAVKGASFDLLEPNIISEEMEHEHKLLAGTGKFLGEATGFVSSLMMTGGALRALPVVGKLMGAMKSASVSTKIIPRVGASIMENSVVGASRALLSETLNSIKEKDPNISDKAKNVMENALMFGAMGGTAGLTRFSPRGVRAISAMAANSTTSAALHISSGEEIDLREVALEGLVGGVFEFISGGNPKSLSKSREVTAKFANLVNMMEENINGDDVRKIMRKNFGVDLNEIEDFIVERIVRLKNPKEMAFRRTYEPTLLESAEGIITGVDKVPKFYEQTLEGQTSMIKKEIGKVLKSSGLTSVDFRKGTQGAKELDVTLTNIANKVFGNDPKRALDVDERFFLFKGIKEAQSQLNEEYKRLGSETRVPTTLSTVTPLFRYIHTLGLREILDPVLHGYKEMSIEAKKITEHLEGLRSEYLKLKGVGLSEKMGATIKNDDPKVLKQLFMDLENKDFDINVINDPKEREIVKTLMQFRTVMLARVNQYQRMFGNEEIKGIEGYVRHFYRFRPNEVLKREGTLQKIDEPIKMKLGPVEKELPQGYQTSPLKERKLETLTPYLVMDPFRAYINMAKADLKTMYLEQPAKMVNFELSKMKGAMPESTARWIGDNILRAFYTGSDTDRAIGAFLTEGKLGENLRGLTKKFLNREFGSNPVQDISAVFGTTLNRAWIGLREDLGVRNLFQRVLATNMVETKVLMKSLLPSPKWLDEIVKEGEFYKRSVSGIEGVGEATSKFDRILNLPQQATHHSNVEYSMKLGALQTDELIMNPKKWKYGFADERRKRGEVPENGERYFKSEKIKMNMEMNEFFGSLTQFDYTTLGFAPTHQSGTGRILFKFWTWPINYTMSYWRELVSRAVYNRPGWASEKSGVTLPIGMRTAAVKHLLYNFALIEAASSMGFDLTSIGWSSHHVKKGIEDKTLSPIITGGPMPERFPPVLDFISATYGVFGKGKPSKNDTSPWEYSTKLFEYKNDLKRFQRYINPLGYLPAASETKKIARGLKENDVRKVFAGSLARKPFGEKNKKRGPFQNF